MRPLSYVQGCSIMLERDTIACMNATVRVARPADLLLLEKLMVQAVRNSLSEGYYDEALANSAARFITIPDLSLILDGTYFVIQQGQDLVACGGWSPRLEPSSDAWIDPGTRPAWLRASFVSPDHMRSGYGTAIYEACENAAREKGYQGFDLLAIWPSVPFYRKIGFNDQEEVVIPLSDGTSLPCLRMEKSFS